MPPDDQQLPDPSTFATPNELLARRAYAKSLIESGQGQLPGPVVSPFSALAGVLNTMTGQRIYGQSAAQERYNNTQTGRASPVAPGEESSSAQTGPLSVPPPAPQMGPRSDNSDPMAHLKASVASMESAGNQNPYGVIGPPTVNRVTGQADRPYGKYQVMGNNIPQWTQQILGTSMTPQQFLASPDAQEKVATAKLSEYNTKYGPEGAAKAWFAGEHGMTNPAATDVNGMSVARYGNGAMTKLASLGPDLPAGALSPPQQANAPAATAAPATGPLGTPPPVAPTQVAGGPRPAGGPGLPNAPATMGVADQPSGTLPMLPRVSRQQFESIMANPQASPQQKQAVWSMYYGQNQPIGVDTAYGGHMIINPRNPNERWVVPGNVQMIPKTVGPITKQVPTLTIPPGSNVGPPQIMQLPVGPQSSAAPTQGAPTQPGATPAGQPTRSALDDASPTLSSADQKAIETGEPLKYAEADTGIKSEGLPPEITQGRSAKAEPIPVSAPGGPLSATPPGGLLPGSHTAQAGPTPDISAEDNQDLQYLQDMDVKKTARETGIKTSLEAAQKYYDGISTQGLGAIQQRDELNEIEKVLNQKNFYSGFLSGPVETWKRAVAALGGNPSEAAAMEAFEKMRNDLNLSSLRTTLGGLGQIRLAEVNMVNSAFANKDNSVAANKALVFLKKRINDRIANAGEVADQYVQAHNGVADQTLRNRIFNYYKNQPLMTDEEIANFQQQIGGEVANKKPSGPLSTPPPGTKAPPPPAGFR